MNDIRPFPGLRFDEQVAGPLSDLLSPPYDVISPEEQLGLYGKSPNNVVRLELGLEHPEDDARSSRYTRATSTLERWITHGVLREDEPAIYLYEQRFTLDGVETARVGVLARLRLARWEDGVVLPHEDTLSGPKEDRLRLMRATACNLSPVFLLFDDPAGAAAELMAGVKSLPAWQVAEIGDGEQHRLWVVRGETADLLVRSLNGVQLFMADGHHRYETALAYRDEMLAADPTLTASSGIDFVMALLVDARDPGLVVLPTHRLVRGVAADRLAGLLDSAGGRFAVEVVEAAVDGRGPAAALEERMRRGDGGPAIGLYMRGEGARLLRFVGEPPQPSDPARPVLDVDLLHDELLEPLLGIGAAELREGNMVAYTRDSVEAVEAVDRGTAQVAFLLKPTRVEQVLETSRAGGRMPQKSTYFYPKPATGLVINPIWIA